MRIILLDKRDRFRDDIRNRLLIDDDRDVELLTDLADSNNLDTAIKRYAPEILVVADNVFVERSTWDKFGVPVVGYVTRQGGVEVFASSGLPFYRKIDSAAHLLNQLEGGIPKTAEQRAESHATTHSQSSQGYVSFNRPIDDEEAYTISSQGSSPRHAEPSSYEMPIYSEPKEHSSSVATTDPIPAHKANSPTDFHSQTDSDLTPKSFETTHRTPENSDARASQPETWSVKDRFDYERKRMFDAAATTSVLEDMMQSHTKTQTIAVYAAKGGVGKTTIATELAVTLSLMSHGRGNYRVCLIDYNIDFGDVLTTLNLDNKGPTLTHWAREIRRKVAAGLAPDSISYTQREIEGRLQQFNNTTLYALVAPIAHEDSMEIESDELSVILKNIQKHGNFDFVICDTGNNTRDSTVIALETADKVLLIATQDVSAVNCDKSFLQTMTRIGFDTSKIRLVLNSIMPYKYTQVSVKEVEDMFPYPCIARFRRDPDVTKANNCSEPIVYQPNHEFTKEMRKIAAYISGQQIDTQTKKINLFASLFKRKE